MVTDVLIIDLGEGQTFFAGPENRYLAGVAATLCDFPREPSGDALPADSFSEPVLLYGPPLSGKTHFARGLAMRWQAAHPDAKVLFLTASDYAREFASACQADAVDMFSQRVRNCDLFVLDGVDALAEKSAAQQHLCRTLDALQRRNALIVITARSLPGQQHEFAAGLVSRLSAALAVFVTLPSPETRQHLASLLAKRHGVVLCENQCRTLAERLPAGVMAIESAISSIAAQQGTASVEALIENILKEQTTGGELPIKSIAAATSRLTGVSVADMKSPSRRSSHVRARGLAMLATRRLTSLSLSAVGNYFGRRDHTTVMHACDKTEQLIRTDRPLQMTWEELLANLTEHQCSPGATTSQQPGEKLSGSCASRSPFLVGPAESCSST